MNKNNFGRKSKAKFFVGTSGFSYSHWEDGVFYPKGFAKSKQLEYYSKIFNTVELNSPFYRLPEGSTFSNWRKRVPENFIFSVKVSRFITHVKKLNQCKDAWQNFFWRAINLKEKLGPFLFQLPPSFKKNLARFQNFINLIYESLNSNSYNFFNFRFVFEFRNSSWFSDDIYNFLKDYENISLCLADSPSFPFKEIITGDFVYIRMHGKKELFSSNYLEKELKGWADKIKIYFNQGLNVYVYFNNDFRGYAPKNAQELIRLVNL